MAEPAAITATDGGVKSTDNCPLVAVIPSISGEYGALETATDVVCELLTLEYKFVLVTVFLIVKLVSEGVNW